MPSGIVRVIEHGGNERSNDKKGDTGADTADTKADTVVTGGPGANAQAFAPCAHRERSRARRRSVL